MYSLKDNLPCQECWILMLHILVMYLALSASFRGRSLKGCVLNLPAGYTGYVMKEEKRPFTDEEVN